MQIYWNKRKQFNSQRIGLGHQHGCRFIVLGHQYGRRDVMWKHSIDGRFSKGHKFLVNVWSLTGISREVGGLRKNPFFGGGMDNFWNHIVLFLFPSNGSPCSLLPLFTSFSGQRPAKWKWKWGVRTLRSQVRCPPLRTHSLVTWKDKHQAPVVEHWIALPPPTGWIVFQGNQFCYPVDSAIHLFNNWEQGWALL